MMGIRNLMLMGIISVVSLAVSPAYALSAKECSVKYQAAKAAGTLNGLKWNDFRKAQCAGDSPAAANQTSAKTTSKSTSKTTPAPASTSSGSGLTMQQCSAKYQAAKTAGTLGSTKWNEFRKTQCSSGASSAPAATTAAVPANSTAASNTSTGGGLTMQQCSAKYQAAKTAGTLGGAKWNDFRKAQCSAGASAAPSPTAAAPAPATTTNNSAPANQPATNNQNNPQANPAVAPAGVAFPTAVSSKYSNESAGKARMHTCLDEYYVNKQNNTLGGLQWIQKGGGYYSLCNSRLKGQ